MPTQWRQAVERINLLGVSPLPTTITGTVELGSGGSRTGHVTLDLAVAELSIAYDDSNGIALDIPVPVDDAPIEVARLRSLFGD